MTLAEFKAWLDGFVEGWGGGNAPTAEQWAKVLTKLGEVREPVDLRPFLRPNEVTRIFETPLLPYGPAVTWGGTAADAVPAWLRR